MLLLADGWGETASPLLSVGCQNRKLLKGHALRHVHVDAAWETHVELDFHSLLDEAVVRHA